MQWSPLLAPLTLVHLGGMADTTYVLVPSDSTTGCTRRQTVAWWTKILCHESHWTELLRFKPERGVTMLKRTRTAGLDIVQDQNDIVIVPHWSHICEGPVPSDDEESVP